jgi:NADPH:quinone reductase-like Zn-dependent oxidoreductase
MAIEEFGDPQRLRPMDLPRPRPERNEVLIRIVAAGVNAIDCRIRAGELRDLMRQAFPLICGWDAAGVVEELGENATRFRKGDRVWVYAIKPVVQWGCYAEFVAVPEEAAAPMPSSLLYEEAASVPLCGLAAYQALFEQKVAVGPGAAVLVLGAGGGVGQFAVELARNAGAKVVASASSTQQEFVMSLGAMVAVDYSKEDFREATRRHFPDGVDLVLDTVGGELPSQSLSVIKPGGGLVSLVDEPDEPAAQRAGVSARWIAARASAEQLTLLARLIDGKEVRTHVRKIYPLAEAAAAHADVEAGQGNGKVVLNL